MAKEITWDAQEYVQAKKRTGWFIGLGVVAAALIALSVWMQAWTFTALVVISVFALLVYVIRPARKIHYKLDDKGLTEGEKLYLFENFKSFGILNENGYYSIVLMPRKRFGIKTVVYFPETQGEKIVDAFGMRLPMEEVKQDALDKLIKFLRI